MTRIKRKVVDYLYDHYGLKVVLKESFTVFLAVLSAAIFSFAFTCFVSPLKGVTEPYFKLVTGGVSGLSQNLALIVSMFGGTLSDFAIEALGYTLFNLPILVFGFIKVGKRFSLYTLINVVSSSLFIYFFPIWGVNKMIASSALIATYPLTRIIFSGMLVGLSSAIAFKAEISCGGIDVVTYYYSNKKSTGVGKYGVIVNFCILFLYFILSLCNDSSDWGSYIISLFYSFLYLVLVNVVVDFINRRNKKILIEAFSTDENLGKILIARFPHSATRETVKGIYSNVDRYAYLMVVSVNETNAVVNLIRKTDPKAFVMTTSLRQVYGNFFIKPIK